MMRLRPSIASRWWQIWESSASSGTGSRLMRLATASAATICRSRCGWLSCCAKFATSPALDCATSTLSDIFAFCGATACRHASPETGRGGAGSARSVGEAGAPRSTFAHKGELVPSAFLHRQHKLCCRLKVLLEASRTSEYFGPVRTRF